MTAESELSAIAELAQAARVGWASYQATEAALAAPTLRAASGPGRSGDTADPTSHIAASTERYWEARAEISEALGHLRALQRRMANVRRHHSETARVIDAAVRAARCSGSVGYPDCTANSVRAGKCWRCYRASLATEAG